MEGWDGTETGAPTDLVRRRWDRFAGQRVQARLGRGDRGPPRRPGQPPPARARPESTVDGHRRAAARRLDPIAGRAASSSRTRAGGAGPSGTPAPRTAYRHPLLDGRVGAGADDCRSPTTSSTTSRTTSSSAAGLAADAGFDFVDVKHCHGYLVHELLARGRPARPVRRRPRRPHAASSARSSPASAPEHRGLEIAVRLSAFDLDAVRARRRRSGRPGGRRSATATPSAATAPASASTSPRRTPSARPSPSSASSSSSITAGSPYYNPHVQRPAYFPPSDGYQPPEDPLVGVARQLAATAELAARAPGTDRRRRRATRTCRSGCRTSPRRCVATGDAD